MRTFWVPALVLLFACSEDPARPDAGSSNAPDAASGMDAASIEDAGERGAGVEGLGLFTRLAGLWSGPITMTPLGDFQRAIMDLRPAGDHVLFGRVDLDEDNALRFAFFIETHGGEEVLVFRNGGLFMGLERDTRTKLIDHDDAAGRWHFCALNGGCAYVDATFVITNERMTLAADVRGQPHVRWNATKEASRTTPSPFPKDETSLGTGDAPFPPLPEVLATVRWSQPLASEADAWVILSTRDCDLASGRCEVARHLKARAAVGATEAQLRFSQIHPGEYRVLAFLDRNQNLDRTLTPDRGDGTAIPNQPLTVGAQGETQLESMIVYDLP
jgi:hypothetical protein